jgi:hypothetical protein
MGQKPGQWPHKKFTLKRTTVIKLYDPIKKDRIRINIKILDILQGADTVQFMKSFRLRWYGRY